MFIGSTLLDLNNLNNIFNTVLLAEGPSFHSRHPLPICWVLEKEFKRKKHCTSAAGQFQHQRDNQPCRRSRAAACCRGRSAATSFADVSIYLLGYECQRTCSQCECISCMPLGWIKCIPTLLVIDHNTLSRDHFVWRHHKQATLWTTRSDGHDDQFSTEICSRGCHWFPRLLA